MTTTARLLALLSLLQTRRDWPGPLLAARLDISHRTVRRDIDRLRELGYRIHASMGPDGGYRLDAGDELPPLLFDDDQALAVAVALRTAPTLGPDIGEAALRALGTLRQVMPSRVRHRFDTLDVTVVRRPGEAPAPVTDLDVLITLARMIRDHQTLRFDYTPVIVPDGGTPTFDSPRRVEPHHLVSSHGRWYLVCWDLHREDWRLYRVDRIQPRTPPGARFARRTVPGGDVDAFVSARFRGAKDDAWPCRGTVLLHLPACDVLPHAQDGTVTAVDEDSCTLEKGSWSWVSLAAFFALFDTAMEVVEPRELETAFHTLAQRYAAPQARMKVTER